MHMIDGAPVCFFPLRFIVNRKIRGIPILDIIGITSISVITMQSRTYNFHVPDFNIFTPKTKQKNTRLIIKIRVAWTVKQCRSIWSAHINVNQTSHTATSNHWNVSCSAWMGTDYGGFCCWCLWLLLVWFFFSLGFFLFAYRNGLEIEMKKKTV